MSWESKSVAYPVSWNSDSTGWSSLQRHANNDHTFQDGKPEDPTLRRKHSRVIPMMSSMEASCVSVKRKMSPRSLRERGGGRGRRRNVLFLSSGDTTQQTTDLISTFLQSWSMFFKRLLGSREHSSWFWFYHDTTSLALLHLVLSSFAKNQENWDI